MYRRTFLVARGSASFERQRFEATSAKYQKMLGGIPVLSDTNPTFRYARAQPPLRAVKNRVGKAVMLYNAFDSVEAIEHSQQHKRIERQVEAAMRQMTKFIRSADDHINEWLMKTKDSVRPSLHQLYFHKDNAFMNNPGLFSDIETKHLVPIISLLPYDVEHGKMTFWEAEEVFEASMDVFVGHSNIVKREVCNGYIRACCLCDEPEKALETVRLMQRKGIRRTFVTYAPLYRYARSKQDVELHLEVELLCKEVEGGVLQKWVFIDTPRFAYPVLVFLRFHWYFLTPFILAFCGYWAEWFMHHIPGFYW